VPKQGITVDTNFNLNKITLNLTKELNLAGQIIKEDHFQRLEKGLGVTGPMASLKPSTVKSKTNFSGGKFKKNANKPLVNTGKMRNLVVEKATKQNQEVEIHPGEKQKYPRTKVTMSDVGGFHQTGAGLPKREWFGITAEAEKDIMKMVDLEIERQIKRA
jgi:phage gpG-like protein|tara:strand:- start:30 stop:509 length:480 start_codon:yes stop_codon:yes gene_type:complete